MLVSMKSPNHRDPGPLLTEALGVKLAADGADSHLPCMSLLQLCIQHFFQMNNICSCRRCTGHSLHPYFLFLSPVPGTVEYVGQLRLYIHMHWYMYLQCTGHPYLGGKIVFRMSCLLSFFGADFSFVGGGEGRKLTWQQTFHVTCYLWTGTLKI